VTRSVVPLFTDVRHVPCGTVVHVERRFSTCLIWCDACDREVALDELDPPGAVCLTVSDWDRVRAMTRRVGPVHKGRIP